MFWRKEKAGDSASRSWAQRYRKAIETRAGRPLPGQFFSPIIPSLGHMIDPAETLSSFEIVARMLLLRAFSPALRTVSRASPRCASLRVAPFSLSAHVRRFRDAPERHGKILQLAK